MQTNSAPTTTIAPPRMIAAIMAGFNLVANHIYLILFPVGLDLLLWFGPHLRIKDLLTPYLTEMNAEMTAAIQPSMKETLTVLMDWWKMAAEHYNLVAGLRSFPVGIPSLFAGSGPLAAPFGAPRMIESPSASGAFTTWLMFALLGLLIGSYYFHLIGHLSMQREQRSSLGQLGWESLQSVLLVILLLIVLLVVFTPVMIFITVLTLISPGLAQIAFILTTMFLIWLLLPLAFSPHGIFTLQLDALRSSILSYRLVRFFLPGTGLFLLVCILISQGLDILWRVPEEKSWMALVGVLGHGFISSGLIAASFIYFANGLRFMQDMMQQKQRSQGVKI